ncbi:MAG: hypothetical protein IPK02_20420 [Candidatus Accumulibacter sp.]|uniref:Uncharacterized protein n=1 Tax=Candidatus Accumulibacter affinis TaxID=2954384 RepID=A0A935TKP7_9PROT|nr:hypothetical protein [Candidatus Accumulibacter affinis]
MIWFSHRAIVIGRTAKTWFDECNYQSHISNMPAPKFVEIATFVHQYITLLKTITGHLQQELPRLLKYRREPSNQFERWRLANTEPQSSSCQCCPCLWLSLFELWRQLEPSNGPNASAPTQPFHPESFIGAAGSSPLVTARVISAWRFLLSSPIRPAARYQVVHLGGLAVKEGYMAVCSATGGNATARFSTTFIPMFCCVPKLQIQGHLRFRKFLDLDEIQQYVKKGQCLMRASDSRQW